ncbi:MAG: YbhB/YbcL family Raf kinase inhibitor-like protein [Oricola sp.]
MAFSLTSSAFEAGGFVPARYACTGENVSPPFEWRDAPRGTKSLVLFCHDPDAPSGTFHHWAVFDIPPDRTALPEALPPSPNLPGGLRQAVNDFGKPGYGGPCPPKGHGVHHYHFRLAALDVERLGLGPRPSCRQVEAAVLGRTLDHAGIVGLFER